jgi:hypothetical protein
MFLSLRARFKQSSTTVPFSFQLAHTFTYTQWPEISLAFLRVRNTITFLVPEGDTEPDSFDYTTGAKLKKCWANSKSMPKKEIK